MKKFGVPHMALVYLVNDDVICQSLCYANYCDGYTCPYCEDHDNCGVQTGCTSYQCPHYLCLEY